jgi:hypothetical protein
MHKGTLSVLVVLAIVMILGALACGSAKLKPAEVVSADISTVSGNTTQIVVQGNFTVKNPNAVPVTLDTFEYALAAGNKTFGYTQLGHDIAMAAGQEISLSGPVVINFGDWIGDAMVYHGMSQVAALEYILPYWKEMGGQNPAPPLQSLWNSVSPGITWTARGSVVVDAGGKVATGNFTVSVTK